MSLCENSMWGERPSGKQDANISKDTSLYCSTSIPLKIKSHRVTVRTKSWPQVKHWLYLEMKHLSPTSVQCFWPRSYGRWAAFFSRWVWTEQEPGGLPVHPADCPALSQPPGSVRRTHIQPPQILSEKKVYERRRKKKKSRTSNGTPNDPTDCVTSWFVSVKIKLNELNKLKPTEQPKIDLNYLNV